MKRFVGVIGLVVGLVCLFGVFPAFAGDVKIGILDLQEIMRESKEAKNVRGMLLMDVEAKREVLKEREQKVREMEKELKAKESVLSESAKEKKKGEFLAAVKELRSLRDGMEEELKKKEAKLLGKIGKEIKKIAEKLRKKKDLAIIIENNAVVIPGDAIDITEEVIKKYDAKKK
ncbi:MAG: OmpH family outer membrane protein [Deltaproteobacteria bacterium]|nr:OmpH family outer membrane protein [Deltaproteobacteria bacterium]